MIIVGIDDDDDDDDDDDNETMKFVNICSGISCMQWCAILRYLCTYHFGFNIIIILILILSLLIDCIESD